MGSSSISVVTRDRVTVRGKDLVDELIGRVSFVDMFLLQLLGREPSLLQRTLVEAVMVAIMEHGLVPSVVSSRLTLYGAPESFQGAVAAGLLGVGDRFAGTASACSPLLKRIADAAAEERPQVAEAIVAEHRAAKQPLPGFGHPNHKDGDPRYHRLIELARTAGADKGYLDACGTLHAALERKAGKPIPANISLAIGALLAEAELPTSAFRGVVLVARCAGLVGHLAEEIADPSAPLMWEATGRAMNAATV